MKLILHCFSNLEAYDFILELIERSTENESCNNKNITMEEAVNVFGEKLELCCTDPMTGFYRDGVCNTGPQDHGTHVICARMTDEFLAFTKSKGNDLQTPMPMYQFPGLKAGDQWCLCALRWREAFEAGVAPPVVLESTHEKALEYVKLKELVAHALKTS